MRGGERSGPLTVRRTTFVNVALFSFRWNFNSLGHRIYYCHLCLLVWLLSEKNTQCIQLLSPFQDAGYFCCGSDPEIVFSVQSSFSPKFKDLQRLLAVSTVPIAVVQVESWCLFPYRESRWTLKHRIIIIIIIIRIDIFFWGDLQNFPNPRTAKTREFGINREFPNWL